MCDFDLSQALEGSPESDDRGFGSCCFNMKDLQNEVVRLDEGLDLVVSHNPKTMQCVAYLLLAVNRMKKSRSGSGGELRDGDLCSVIMDSVVDETIVKTTENVSTGGIRGNFQRVNSVKLCTLCDTSQKDIVHKSGALNLQAITLRGGHRESKVSFKLSRYITPCVSAGEGQTVVLSITNSNLHLSCSLIDGRAVLNLEECSEGDLRTISSDGNMNRFLFYKRASGLSLTSFESVRHRGWFISTSYEGENQPVEMCEADTARRLTCFKLN
ncbi:interleukin-1 beta [Chelmon rostratus]|uniref:interleukin-1 beta n=1 Tax=Chelmon rostratus TaxID=109905 RepID=UPI001BEA85C6|nr:interleukin-1 beta [Chelmon rostratus]